MSRKKPPTEARDCRGRLIRAGDAVVAATDEYPGPLWPSRINGFSTAGNVYIMSFIKVGPHRNVVLGLRPPGHLSRVPSRGVPTSWRNWGASDFEVVAGRDEESQSRFDEQFL